MISRQSRSCQADQPLARLCRLGITVFLVSILVLSQRASLAQVFVSTTSTGEINPGSPNRGYFYSYGTHDPTNNSYFAGSLDLGPPNGVTGFHDFFSFDLTGLDLTGKNIVGATLTLSTFGISEDGTFTLYDSNASASTLMSAFTDAPGIPIYDDLGNGTSYGAYPIDAMTDANTDKIFTLNSAAFADIKSGAGGYFSVGGVYTGSTDNAFIFGASDTISTRGNLGVQTLTLTLAPAAVPEPSSYAFMAVSLFVGAGFLLRRRAMNCPMLKTKSRPSPTAD